MAFYRRLQTAEEKSNLQGRCHAVLKEWLDCWNVSRAFSGVLATCEACSCCRQLLQLRVLGLG